MPPFVRLTGPAAAKRSGRGREERGRHTGGSRRGRGRRHGDLETLGDDLSVADRTPSGVVLHGEGKRRTGSGPGELLKHEPCASRSRDPQRFPIWSSFTAHFRSSRTPVPFRTRHANRGTAASLSVLPVLIRPRPAVLTQVLLRSLPTAYPASIHSNTRLSFTPRSADLRPLPVPLPLFLYDLPLSIHALHESCVTASIQR